MSFPQRRLSVWCYVAGQPQVQYIQYLQTLSFTTLDPGGYGDLQMTLITPTIRVPRAELKKFAFVVITSNLDVRWQGEIVESNVVVDSSGERYTITALGLGNGLRDDPQTTSYTTQTVAQVMANQFSIRSAYIPIDADQSQVFPTNPAATFSPSYVNKTMEEVTADLCALSGDYHYGVWSYSTSSRTPGGTHTDASGFPTGQLQVAVRDKATTHYMATYAAKQIYQHQVTDSAERAFNVIKVLYYDLSTGPGTATATDTRLAGSGAIGTAPFRRRVYSRDLSGVQTVTATQAANIASSLLTLYQNGTNKVQVTLRACSTANNRNQPLDGIQANHNIFLPDLTNRAGTLSATPQAGVNQYHIVKTTYTLNQDGSEEVVLECDNFFDSQDVEIARLQLAADAAARNNSILGDIQAQGAAEKGLCGGTFYGTTNGNTYSIVQNFRSTMMNVPTNITFVDVQKSNVSGSFVLDGKNQWGFWGHWQSTGGTSQYYLYYQTVGN